MILQAKKYLSNDFVNKEYQNIINFFDSASIKSDSIFIDEYYNPLYLQYLIDLQLIEGNAKVYDKKNKSFVASISHRLQRYGEHADRLFFLPDKRPFFFTMEYSGILDKEPMFPNSHYNDYIKESEILQSIRKE